jgi:hypothetical protein
MVGFWPQPLKPLLVVLARIPILDLAQPEDRLLVLHPITHPVAVLEEGLLVAAQVRQVVLEAVRMRQLQHKAVRLPWQAVLVVLPPVWHLITVCQVRQLLEELAEAAVHISPESLAWQEPLEDSLVVAVAEVALPTTASTPALAELVALVLSTSSLTANP